MNTARLIESTLARTPADAQLDEMALSIVAYAMIEDMERLQSEGVLIENVILEEEFLNESMDKILKILEPGKKMVDAVMAKAAAVRKSLSKLRNTGFFYADNWDKRDMKKDKAYRGELTDLTKELIKVTKLKEKLKKELKQIGVDSKGSSSFASKTFSII